MTTSISLPQHVPEARYGGKMPVTNGHNVSAQPMPLENMALPALPQSDDDPYVFAQQVLANSGHRLASSEAELYTSGGGNSRLTDTPVDAPEVLAVFRRSQRDVKKSDDNFNAMKKSVAKATAGEGKTPPHISALEGLIESIHGNYQKNYAKINEKAAEFMKDVNTALGKISEHIGTDKEGKLTFKPRDFVRGLDSVFSKYTNFKVNSDADYGNWSPDDKLTKPIYTFSGDKAAFNFWEKKLGSGFSVKQIPGNKIQLLPNLTAIRNVYNSVANSKPGWDGGEVHAQIFQSLQTAIDSQKSAVNSGVSQLLERFRQDNSTFETMIQLLTKMTEDLHRYNAGYLQ